MTDHPLPDKQPTNPLSSELNQNHNLPSSFIQQQCVDSPNVDHSADSTPGKKRKFNSHRGIANLTAEQLAKKRANDREAQRAIRNRTRSQIEALERRVQELTSQQPYRDLQEALRQKEIAHAENDDIQKRLASVLAIIQPIVNSSNPQGTNAASPGVNTDATGSTPSESRTWPGTKTTVGPPSPASHSDLSVQHQPNSGPYDQPSRTLGSLEPTGATNYPCSPGASLDSLSPASSGQVQGYRQNWQSNVPSSHSSQQGWSSSCSQMLEHQRRNLTHGLDFSGNDEKLGLGFLLGSSQNVPKVKDFRQSPNPPSASGQMRYQQAPVSGGTNPFGDSHMKPYSIPVRNVEPTCPMDGILLDFLHTRQREAADGVSTRQLVGPPYPSVSSLLNPAKSAFSHPLSKVFTDVLSTFPGISTIPEQVAVLYIMFLIMRWQIYPTRENYDRLPEWVTPRASQLITPHPAWMDYLPWPRMRDRMIASYADFDFMNWFLPYTTGISINWPYEPTDALLSTPGSEELTINPVFERHLRDLNNWSLGPAFAKAYPSLVDTTKIKPDVKELQGPSGGSG